MLVMQCEFMDNCVSCDLFILCECYFRCIIFRELLWITACSMQAPDAWRVS